MPETAILLQISLGGIKGARRAQRRAEGRKGGQEGRQGGQEGRQGGQEGRSALLFWPSWNTVWNSAIVTVCISVQRKDICFILFIVIV